LGARGRNHRGVGWSHLDHEKLSHIVQYNTTVLYVTIRYFTYYVMAYYSIFHVIIGYKFYKEKLLHILRYNTVVLFDIMCFLLHGRYIHNFLIGICLHISFAYCEMSYGNVWHITIGGNIYLLQCLILLNVINVKRTLLLLFDNVLNVITFYLNWCHYDFPIIFSSFTQWWTRILIRHNNFILKVIW